MNTSRGAAHRLVNVARFLPEQALNQPDFTAVRVPRGRTPGGEIRYLDLSFSELNAEADAWVSRMRGAGIVRGTRVLLMVRPGLSLIGICFALFKLGAVPVVIDPGMGLRSFLRAVERSRPEAVVAIPLGLMLSRVFRRPFASVTIRVGVSSDRPLAGNGVSVEPVELASTGEHDLAAILFTSGSTGAPKGVCYEHGMFEAQVEAIRAAYDIRPGEVDLPMLPVFALFNPALGMTTVVPEMNPSRPATVDPAKIVQAIRQCGVTNSFGSPVLWRKIADHCLSQAIQLPSLKRILMAGAPVPPELMADFRNILPDGHVHSPYGATEALPVSTIKDTEVLRRTAPLTGQGRGTCVGRPLPGVSVKIIEATPEALGSLAEVRTESLGSIGEIVVCGRNVTRRYDGLEEATARAKIPDGEGVWHRMGDLGYIDREGLLWFCGRKVERVDRFDGTPFYTDCCEAVFNRHPSVARTALIACERDGRRVPAVVIEPKRGFFPKSARRRRMLAEQLRALGRESPVTAEITNFYFHKAFPVDVRHNAKIHRLTLTRQFAGKEPCRVD